MKIDVALQGEPGDRDAACAAEERGHVGVRISEFSMPWSAPADRMREYAWRAGRSRSATGVHGEPLQVDVTPARQEQWHAEHRSWRAGPVRSTAGDRRI